MKKETADKMDGIVDPVGEQNGHSESEEWKKALEREKLELEIEKIRADKEKAALEIKDLKRPPFFRAAFITVLGPAVLSLFAAGMAIYFGGYSQQIARLNNANAELANKESAITDKNKEVANLNIEIDRKTIEVGQLKERAEKQLVELNQRIEDFQANTEKERKEKEAFQNTNKNLQAQQNILQSRLASLNSQKEENQAVVENLRFEYDRLNNQIKDVNEKVKIIRLEEPFAQLVSEANEEDVSPRGAFPAGKATISRIFDMYPHHKPDYENYFRNAIEKNYSIRQKLRIASLLYHLTSTNEWKIRFNSLVKEALIGAVDDIERGTRTYALNITSIVGDIYIIDREKSLSLTFDAMRHEIGRLSAEKIRLVFIMITMGRPTLIREIRKNGIFFRFLGAGLDKAFYGVDVGDQKRGLELIAVLAGRKARDIFMFYLHSKGRITDERVEEILKGKNQQSGPINLLELKKWSKENQCLNDYWTKMDLSNPEFYRSKFDSVLLEKRIKGECS